MNTSDILIIGGGIVGSSIAYNLKNDGFTGRVTVFEKDRSYEFASTTLAAGGVRQQFANPLNIRMVQYAVDFYENFDRIMAIEGEPAYSEFQQNGYLYLADAENRERFERNFETQKRVGADVKRLNPEEAAEILAGYDLKIAAEGIEAGYWGPRDGRLDPYSVLQGFVRKSKNLGVNYVYDEVKAMTLKSGRIESLTTKGGDRFAGTVVVNAAGAWAQEVGKLAGVSIPVVPTNHMNYLCRIPKKFPRRLPMTIFPNRVWFMGESESQIITALTRPDPKTGFDFSWDREYFMETVWPMLAGHVPLFETLRLERGYAGLYEISPDECCILGEHPEVKGFYLANGFSGHGVMQAPATGKLISELIRLGRYETLDASDFSLERFEKGGVKIPEKMN